jgi:hypothetical protein
MKRFSLFSAFLSTSLVQEKNWSLASFFNPVKMLTRKYQTRLKMIEGDKCFNLEGQKSRKVLLHSYLVSIFT